MSKFDREYICKKTPLIAPESTIILVRCSSSNGASPKSVQELRIVVLDLDNARVL